MDQIYLKHAALYEKLVQKFNDTKRPPSQKEEQRQEPGASSRELAAAGSTVVCARIRPLLDEDAAAGFPCAVYPRPAQANVVDIHDLYNHPRGRPVLKSFSYCVDALFEPEASTEDIYDELVADLVAFARDGGVGTLFAYGQTGSGKTFTISQLEKLVAAALMDWRAAGPGRRVYLTMVDLAGSSASDLLGARGPVSVREDAAGEMRLAGAEEREVRCRDEAAELIERAAGFRRTAPTEKNGASSRSHGIARIRITNGGSGDEDGGDGGGGDGSEGLLYLVDLAGSEGARDVATHGAERMRETREINRSLSVLKDCIRSKAELDKTELDKAALPPGSARGSSSAPRVPFRESTLTKALKHVFDPAPAGRRRGRPCRTVVVACVNPCLGDAGPSKNTLRYAEMLRGGPDEAAGRGKSRFMDF
ncbi:hypothetical protein N3K66_004046 [Trichothecium roseum]|uniref:Uncharacterized protein n=1 Tax=Trichothecium roseum TaxID=47278 RepID=A0ACC0V767_9HYPO|nr:hypothetical protein N3K66_004046 [Trichothecium roseum]